MSPRNTTFLTTSALVFALALALAGPSQARPVDIGGSDRDATAVVIPNDRVGPLGVGAAEFQTQTSPDWFERAAQRGETTSVPATVRPDDRGGARGVGTLYKPDIVVSPTTADDGSDWQTIGFGAGAVVLALCAAALGALMLAGHRRTPAH